jgi:hypothetical protein
MQLAHAAYRPAEERIATLRPLVGAYAAALSTPLSESEWQALPLALAQQPLWGIGEWVRKLPSEAQAKEHARATGGAVAGPLPWPPRPTGGSRGCAEAPQPESVRGRVKPPNRPAMPGFVGRSMRP